MENTKLIRIKKLVNIVQNSDMADVRKRVVFNDIGALAVKERLTETELEELRKYIGEECF